MTRAHHDTTILIFQGDVVDKAAEWSGGGEWGLNKEAVPGGQTQTEQSSLELGELEQLTITNDNDLNYDQVSAESRHMVTVGTSIFVDVIQGGISQDMVSQIHSPLPL